MNIGGSIAALRKERDMTQDDLARVLFVSRDLVSKWENGVRRPDYPMIEKIALALGVSADDVVRKDELLFEELGECLPEGTDISEDELVAALNAFLNRLGRREADIFIKRYYHLMSHSEIASVYSIGENHVRSRLSKTRAKFRKYVKEALK